MKSARMANGFFAVGMIAVFASFFVSNSPAKGWLVFVGFGSAAAHNFLNEWAGHPRRGPTYGVFMLVAAVAISSGYLWPTAPAWWKDALSGLLLLSVAWILVEQKKSVSVDGSFWAPLKVPLTPSRVVRGSLFALVTIALPPLFFFWFRK